MVVRYPQKHKVTLSYEDVFNVHLFENDYYDIEDILEIVKADFKHHPTFEYCNVIDATTGEVLAICYNRD